MNENVTELVPVTLRGGVEEERRLSNEEKDPTTSKELNKVVLMIQSCYYFNSEFLVPSTV